MNPTIPKLNFSIQTDVYQGPFELVLDLIASRKLLVNDLALANITEEFIQHVRSQAVFPMEEAANFIQLAATLLLIKSKSLIPDLELTEEENADIDDLKRRLEAYGKVREATRELSRIFAKNVLLPAAPRPSEPFFAPSRDLSIGALSEALARMIAAREAIKKLPEARVRALISIEEVMDNLAARVQKTLTLSFREFTGNAREKVDIIVSFLALLELAKRGAIAIDQFEPHGDIKITNTMQPTTPHYH